MIFKILKNKKFLSVLVVLYTLPLFALTPVNMSAYELLAPLPGVTLNEGSATTTTQSYIPGIVTLIISFAAVLAVLRIIFAGIKYMTTEAYQGKGEAKKDIQNAVWGLLLAMGAWLILSAINPKLTEFNLDIKTLDQGEAIGSDLGETITIDPDDPVLEGCHECMGIALDLPHKQVPGGCAAINPLNEAPVKTCMVSKALNLKLVSLSKILEKRGVSDEDWIITEMYPPTIDTKTGESIHKSSCHNPPLGGMCVDAKIQDTNMNDSKKIGAFLSAIVEEGNWNFIYEVPTQERFNELRSDVLLRPFFNNDQIKVTGAKEHVHLGFFR